MTTEAPKNLPGFLIFKQIQKNNKDAKPLMTKAEKLRILFSWGSDRDKDSPFYIDKDHK